MARLDDVFGSMTQGAIPGSRLVQDLQAALGAVRTMGGSIRSETRTAPGIGSWAFVADHDGVEVVLWEDDSSVRGIRAEA